MRRQCQFWILLTALSIGGCDKQPAGDSAKKENPLTTAGQGTGTAADTTATKEKPGVTRETWGKDGDHEVYLYTLRNKNGMVAKITNWGATVTEVRVPDKDGKFDDVVLGFNTLDGYLKKYGEKGAEKSNPAYFGGIIGRYCNRIGGASFKLDGKDYPLAANNGKNHLHGGKKGWDKLIWQGQEVKSSDSPSVKFMLVSPDSDEGYPGNVQATVVYTLTDDNALRVEMTATTDKPTPLSLTNHSYFNLAGEGSGTVLDHQLELKANHYTAFGDGGVPTGVLATVEASPLDFRKPTRIGERIDQLKGDGSKGDPGGYDHNYVLREKKSDKPEHVATVFDPKTGRTLDIDTTEVGVQFYTGNYLDGTLPDKRGGKYNKNAGLCLEPQFFPDSPNKPNFPSPVLKPGETYRQVTVYRFGVRK